MDVRALVSKTQLKLKLPVTVDWWREVESSKGKNNYAQLESLESPTPELMPHDNPDALIQRNTTLESGGEIDVSSILFPIQSETERQIYEKNCERLQCPSCRKFGKTLDNLSLGFHSDDVNMAHYGLTSMGVRATAISISNMSQCSIIDLKGNNLNASSLTTLVNVIKNSPITEINLSSTGISKFGPKILYKWIATSMRIKKLYLRDNKFDDVDGNKLFEAVSSSRSLVVVDLAENQFCIHCGDSLKKLLDENDILETLDLSWNHIRLHAAISIAKGLKKNNGIKTLNLSWNGLEDASTKEIGLSMKDNDCLQELELVCNRITDVGFKMLMKGLEKNATLKTIHLGRNLITQDTAEGILTSLGNGELRDCGVITLDFTNIIFKPSFQNAIDSIKAVRSEFTCRFGYEDGYRKKRMITYNPVREAFEFLRSYAEEHNIDFVELYKKLDLEGQMKVTHEEFRRGIEEAAIPMSEGQVDILIEYLDSRREGKVDYSELVARSEHLNT